MLVLLPTAAQADVVTDWNEVSIGVGRRLRLGPNRSSRIVAITHLAVHDAVVSITRSREPYLDYVEVPDGPISLEAAGAQAAHDALLLLQPTDAAEIDYALERTLATIPDGVAKENGVRVGFLAAANLVYDRVNDGSAETETYDIAEEPDAGKWRPTPLKPPSTGAPEPAGLPAAQPEWRGVRPFGLLSPAQFRAPSPPLLTDAVYADALHELHEVGGLSSASRTADQAEMVSFWRQETHIPWNAIARTVSRRKAFSLEQNVHLFAILNVALADSRIAAWDSKYAHGFWRPISAIRAAEADGNDATIADVDWAPFLETPNHPDYVSGHSATGAAGAAVLASFFGDDTEFSVGSDTLAATARSFVSFSHASQENADSRVYGGIHFRFSNDAGLELGNQVGTYVVQTLLQPIEVGEGGQGGAGAGGQSNEGGASGGEGAGESGEPSPAAGTHGAAPPSLAGEGGQSAAGAGGEGLPASGGAPSQGGVAGVSAGGPSGGWLSSGGEPAIPQPKDDTGCAFGSAPARGTAAWLLLVAAGVAHLRRRRIH